MRLLRPASIFSYSLAIVTLLLTARAAAEPVQTSFTVDANTTALYLFKEGQGTSSACEVGGVPAAVLNGASWVPGRQYYAVAMDSGYVSINDAPAVRPTTAVTAEAWIKLQQSSGDLICKNGTYLLRLGSSITATFWRVGGSMSVTGVHSVPIGKWTHLAITYDSATQTGSIYINGVLDAQRQVTVSNGLLSGYGSSLRLGTNDWNPMGSEVDGKIDSLRISNVARHFDPLSTTPPPEAPTPKGNLVPNGDFESGLVGWRGDGYGDVNLVWETTGGAVSGQKCLHTLTAARTDYQALLHPASPVSLRSRPIPVSPGRHYTFSYQVKANPQYNPRIQVDGTGTTDGSFPSLVAPTYPTVNNTWQQVTRSFTVPSSFTAPSMCVYLQYPSSGDLWIDNVRIVAGEGMNMPALRDRIAVGPQTLPVGSLFVAGTQSPITLNIVNTSPVAHDVTVQPTIVDCEERSVPAGPPLGTFNVGPNSSRTTTYNIDTSRRGTFRLGFDLTSEGQTWHQLAEIKYAVIVNMQNVGNADNSIFGMNTHMEREPSVHLTRSMNVLSQCGVKWIRAWWGWGMCEATQGTFDFTEYDRQFNGVTNGTGMRIMPILLRYYSNYEYSWAGPVSGGNAIQEYPYASMLPEWTVWVGKVAQHFSGQIKAYELWNEPTMGSSPNGVLTSQQYANLINATTPALRQYDPNAKLVAFAGTPVTGTTNASIHGVLALNTISQMDVLSEHSYSQLALPEINYPKELTAVKAELTAVGAPNLPIWHSEQGLSGDGDGYLAPTISEADIAGLYVRNIITAASLTKTPQGTSSKFFWFSWDVPPTYGMTVFYGDYVPRPRLAALNAGASFLEGLSYQKSYNPSNTTTFAHLFSNPSAAVCVVWNSTAAANLSLSIPAASLQAFDMMGNAIPVGGVGSATIQLPRERPVYLKCAAADYNQLDSALTGMTATDVPPFTIVARPIVGGVQVTLTGQSSSTADGIVDLIPAATKTPPGWPAPQRFQGLGMGESKTFRFVLPNRAAVSQVRVIYGDRRLREVRVPYTGR